MGLKDKIAVKIAPLNTGKKSVPINFRVTNSFILAVENLKKEMGINSTSEAVRVLAEVALEVMGAEDHHLPQPELPLEAQKEFMAFRQKFSLCNQDLIRLMMSSWVALK
jgi:hypothetical protein